MRREECVGTGMFPHMRDIKGRNRKVVERTLNMGSEQQEDQRYQVTYMYHNHVSGSYTTSIEHR